MVQTLKTFRDMNYDITKRNLSSKLNEKLYSNSWEIFKFYLKSFEIYLQQKKTISEDDKSKVRWEEKSVSISGEKK